jgi:hypothetical protein
LQTIHERFAIIAAHNPERAPILAAYLLCRSTMSLVRLYEVLLYEAWGDQQNRSPFSTQQSARQHPVPQAEHTRDSDEEEGDDDIACVPSMSEAGVVSPGAIDAEEETVQTFEQPACDLRLACLTQASQSAAHFF